jgi:hypothetical protein
VMVGHSSPPLEVASTLVRQADAVSSSVTWSKHLCSSRNEVETTGRDGELEVLSLAREGGKLSREQRAIVTVCGTSE